MRQLEECALDVGDSVLRNMRRQRHYMLFWRYLNANCANMETTVFAKSCCISTKPPSAQSPTTCDFQPTLSELLKRFLSKKLPL